MKWIVVNALGASAWLLGLLFAKADAAPQWDLPVTGDHHLMLGVVFGLVGLITLLWTNLSSTA